MDYQGELEEYDGHLEGEDELSPEDRALMEQGKAAVREVLAGQASKVTTAQIEEALWHYYYDLDKTVAYLISKFIDPPKKTPKAAPASNVATAGKKQGDAAGTKSKKGSRPSAESVANGVGALKIDDAPLPKSKNLDVLSEFHTSKSKKTASFVVVGHVDAGKSTMMGRLLLDLGVVDQRTVDKLRQEADKIGKKSFASPGSWTKELKSGIVASPSISPPTGSKRTPLCSPFSTLLDIKISSPI